MRRITAVLASACLTVLLASSVMAAPTAKSMFVGDFDVIDPGTGIVAGHVVAQFALATDRQVAPGSFQFTGASGYPIRAMRVAVADSLFWIDPNGGLPHAAEVGAGCDIFNPGDYSCHGDWAVMFRMVPGEPNSLLFSSCKTGDGPLDFDWDGEGGCAFLLTVGKGDWVLKVAPE